VQSKLAYLTETTNISCLYRKAISIPDWSGYGRHCLAVPNTSDLKMAPIPHTILRTQEEQDTRMGPGKKTRTDASKKAMYRSR
jgi:hypothetical protein